MDSAVEYVLMIAVESVGRVSTALGGISPGVSGGRGRVFGRYLSCRSGRSSLRYICMILISTYVVYDYLS
jgi:hypothetical protein